MNSRKHALLWTAGGLGVAVCFAAVVWGVSSYLASSPHGNRGSQVARNDGPPRELRRDFPVGEAPREVIERRGGIVFAPPMVGEDDQLDPAFIIPAGKAERPALPEDVKAIRGPAVTAKEQTITGPFTHGQLSVFLVHGKGARAEGEVLTLQEALERGLATVHEGGIRIDNHSDRALFVQSGDVIKGGNQDRTLPYDYLIPARKNGFPVQVYCVESGRSFPRAGELSTSFAVSSERLPTRELRLAAYNHNQGAVWSNVSRLQDMLARETGGDVRGALSKTSLQLTLEHPTVQNGAQQFLIRLLGAADKRDDVLGAVFVINGRVVSGDIYSSPELFQRFWPKLLKAAAVEAMAEGHRDVSSTATSDNIRDFLTCDASSLSRRTDTGGLAHMIRGETSTAHVFDTCTGGIVLHRSLIAR